MGKHNPKDESNDSTEKVDPKKYGKLHSKLIAQGKVKKPDGSTDQSKGKHSK